MKMEHVSMNSSKGFTLNMSHYVKQVTEVKDGFIINGNSWLRVFVDSTYELGYFFGASVSRAVVNLSNYRGQVFFRMYDDEDCTKLYESIEEAFNVAPRFRDINKYRYELIVYSKPIAKLLSEFGKGESRTIPSKYLVDNPKYLRGIHEGIEDFGGHLVDEREIIRKIKFSHNLKKIFDLTDKYH